MLLFVYVLPVIILIFKTDGSTEGSKYWETLAREDLEAAFSIKQNNGLAKNVILFVGDGMGLTTITASRIYDKTEKGYLSFEKFPNIGVLKTYSANFMVPDSCSTATALFCGVKANQKTAGVDATVFMHDCEASLKEESRIKSILHWAQDAGKATGFVTTTRVTHATPSALYAHTPNRKWECEDNIPKNSTKCKDIARQLIEDSPGKNINVIMGGGRQCLESNRKDTEADPIDSWCCNSRDGRNLINDWKKHKLQLNVSHKVVTNTEELNNLNLTEDYVLGVFANGHLKMNYARDKGPKGMPSLEHMTEKAIQILSRNVKGFVLMVEGGLIDFAHHRGHAKQALNETIEFNKAIEKALDLTRANKDETLVIVTSDHSHSLVFTGYSSRNNSILGIAQKSKNDNIPYTSLLYGTGGPNNFQFHIENNTVVRNNPQLDNTEDDNYAQQSVVLQDEVAHSGTDVVVYATGPMSHLFNSVHEQTYVAYVIAYAAKIGPFDKNNSKSLQATPFCILFIFLVIKCFALH